VKNFFSEFISLFNALQKRETAFANAPVIEFEKKLANYLDVNHVTSVASGTDALILSLKALDIGPGNEVIIPAVSAFSTAGAVKWIGAVPVFVDVKLADFTINPALVESAITPKTKAIIPVHLNGIPADMEKISTIAKRFSLFVIEDAAQAIGTKYKEKSVGSYGDLACLSFNHTKILGTYSGGAIITNNPVLARKCSILSRYGAASWKELHLNHPFAGIASSLSPLHAALLTVQLGELENNIRKRQEYFHTYAELLQNVGDITHLKVPECSSINGYRYPLLTKHRNELLETLQKENIAARSDHKVPLPFFKSLNNYHKVGDFPVAEQIAEEGLFLPTHPSIPSHVIMTASRVISNFFKNPPSR